MRPVQESMDRIRIALQRSGRLSTRSTELLAQCGLEFEQRPDRLLAECGNFPLDVLLLRDDDIPEYVANGVCDLGIVGENVLEERLAERDGDPAARVEIVRRLGFGQCRLALALPVERAYAGPKSLVGLRIATSYPHLLGRFLARHGVVAQVVELSGSVEIAPMMGVADAICDLVASGATLRSNGLREVETILQSEGLLIAHASATAGGTARAQAIARLLQRIDGVQRAERTKYVTMNAPRAALEEIRRILPGLEGPSVMPLADTSDRIAIGAVCAESIFWETIERLKAAGATGILVMPIEKIIA